MSYIFLKHLHMSFILGSLFLLWGRFIAQSYFQPMHRKWVTALAHTVDLCLVGVGVVMVFVSQIPLLSGDWLMAKIVGLCCYITFGVFALRSTNTQHRWAWLVLAMTSLVYIVGVALTKSPVLALIN